MQLFSQWAVLETLTPSEYLQFRPFLRSASGFQSAQHRAIELTLGHKDPGVLRVFEDQPETHALLTARLAAPSLYDEFLRAMARRGHDLPPEVTDRDWTQPYRSHPAVLQVFKRVYAEPSTDWNAYEMCEKL